MRSLAFLLLVTGACSAYDGDIGPTPYLCGETDPPCPEGYACQDDVATGERVCVGNNGMLSTDFDCADDSAVEPNNLLADATMTGLGTGAFAREGLSICPAGDKDLFAITIATQGETIEFVADFQSDGVPLVGAILNRGGIAISTAVPIPGELTKIRARAPQLAPGDYYVQVAGGAKANLTLNNYELTIDITGP